MVLGIFGKGEKVVPVGVYEENCRENILKKSFFILFLSDILQGRSICRALWDYYKISGHIGDL